VPRPDVVPRDIFITAFDSAPLAVDIISPTDKNYLEEGIRQLAKLTDGTVYLGARFGSGISVAGAEVVEFQGPHPVGNVGVQIANIKPVNKGEVVWALDARAVVRIGKLFVDKTLDTTAEVAITGPEIEKPQVVKTTIGVALDTLLKGKLKSSQTTQRIISGNVLTGYKATLDADFLRYPYRQVTAIQEGETTDEFMGWASLSPKKFSVKHSFPAFLRGLKKPFDFDARVKGGVRAMIVSGEYDKVFPMDIYPEYLLKAIIANDIDKMEKLGIYEVAPEDFALAEFVDTSKIELQHIVKEGLARLRKELE
jgi:Na+-transporting NADH:ubiquinone oxidoreductase subunit A